MILTHMNERDVYPCVQEHVLTHRSAEFVFYGPVSNTAMMQIREICAQTNDLSIAYCERCRIQHENAGDIGLADLFANRKIQRVRLQLQYNEILRREIRQQFFL